MNKPVEFASDAYGILIRNSAKTDIERLAEQIRMLGYGVLDSGLDAKEVTAVKAAFERTRKSYLEQFDADLLSKINELHTIRAMLVHGEPVFRQLATNQRVLALVSSLIRGQFLLNQQNGVMNPPKEKYNQGKWHRDLPYQHFVTSTPLAINALYCVDDFTTENGATVVLPATHKTEAFPSSAFIETNALQISAKAGSFIVLDCMIYHKGNMNHTDRMRRAINHVYTIPYIKQQVSLPRLMSEHDLSDQERQLFGYDCPECANITEFLSRYGHGRVQL
jgi:ectoine hydroxylase-related dioxygenase (phytanoyl-CoA dioxygenase family)